MILSNKGRVQIGGMAIDILAELAEVSERIHTNLMKKLDEEDATKLVNQAVNMGIEMSRVGGVANLKNSDDFEQQRIKDLERIIRGEQNGKGEKQSDNHRKDN